MNGEKSSPLVGYLTGVKSAKIYVDVETARRSFHIMEQEAATLSRTDWKLHRLIRRAVDEGCEVIWLHVRNDTGDGWVKYPLILDESLYALVS